MSAGWATKIVALLLGQMISQYLDILEGDIGVKESVVGLPSEEMEENERDVPSFVSKNLNDKVAEATSSLQLSEKPKRFW